MTSETAAQSPSSAERPRRSATLRTDLGHKVADRARVLQMLSNRDVPSAVRALAVLRRAVGTAPGSDPNVWADTIGLVPDAYLEPQDAPNAAELAAHHAMTLFALHRQGRAEKAHEDGVAPGTAFARLAWLRGGAEESDGVRRRFDAMITASSPEESARHLRGLVLLLRSGNVPLDYGLLAEDLADLWSVRGQNRARLRWARQYRSLGAESSRDTENQTASSTTNRNPEE